MPKHDENARRNGKRPVTSPVKEALGERAQRLLRNLGRTIGDIRRSKPSRMSQSELAKKAGITQGYLSEVEAGTRRITIPVLLQICDSLEVDLAELVIKAELSDRELEKVDLKQVEFACAIIERACREG